MCVCVCVCVCECVCVCVCVCARASVCVCYVHMAKDLFERTNEGVVSNPHWMKEKTMKLTIQMTIVGRKALVLSCLRTLCMSQPGDTRPHNRHTPSHCGRLIDKPTPLKY